jgi:hypothetical protein
MMKKLGYYDDVLCKRVQVLMMLIGCVKCAADGNVLSNLCGVPVFLLIVSMTKYEC